MPWRLPVLRTYLNGLEYFIHNEDLRRANDRPARTVEGDLTELCWRAGALLGRRLAHALRPYGLELVDEDGRSRRLGRPPFAVLVAPPTELVLFLSGRREAALVERRGDAAALRAMSAATTRL